MKMIRFALILAVICVIASGILAFTYKVTKPYIDLQNEKKEKEALNAVIPGAKTFEKKLLDFYEYYAAFSDNKLIGYVIPVETQGYSSVIRLLAGIDTKGVILGVAILDQNETPGLGSKITEIKYGQNLPWFTQQLSGKKAPDLNLSTSGVQAITGATISSRAVVEGISKKAVEFLKKIK